MSDDGKEFVNRKLRDWLETKGVRPFVPPLRQSAI